MGSRACVFHWGESPGFKRAQGLQLCLESILCGAAASQTTPYQTAGIADAADGGATEGICHADNFTGLIQTRNCLAICIDYLALIVHIRAAGSDKSEAKRS